MTGHQEAATSFPRATDPPHQHRHGHLSDLGAAIFERREASDGKPEEARQPAGHALLGRLDSQLLVPHSVVGHAKHSCCSATESHPILLCSPWTAAHQAPLFMVCARQEYWSRLPFAPPGDLRDPGIEPMSPVWAGGFYTTGSPVKSHAKHNSSLKRVPS